MHGLVNKTIEAFVVDTYGQTAWQLVAQTAGLEDPHFEAMMLYPSALTPLVIESATKVLQVDRADFLQNIGTFLISGSSQQAVRRLLRFGGVDFVDFLYSLDDLHDRARLAVADLDLPRLELREHTPSQYSLTLRSQIDGFGHVMVGLLTAMADDYGALVMLEHGGRRGDIEAIAIVLLETAFTSGNRFDLAVGS